MSTVTLLTALFCLIIGGAVLGANPRRFANQVFACISLLIFLRNCFLYLAILAGEELDPQQSIAAAHWLRYVAAITAFGPWSLWLLKESFGENDSGWRATFRGSVPWLGSGVFCAALSFTSLYIPYDSSVENQKRGIFYYIYNTAALAAFIILIVQTRSTLASSRAIQRIEMQFVALNVGISAVLIAIVAIGRSASLLPDWIRAPDSLILFGAYALMAWAITHHRILDARQVFLALAQRLVLVAVLCAGILGVRWLAGFFLSSPLDLAAGVLLPGLAAFWLDRRTREWLRLDGEELLGEWRAAVLAAAHNETQPERIAQKFEETARTLCQSPFAALLFERGGAYAAEKLQLPAKSPGLVALSGAGWATPENLQRRRPTTGLDELRQVLGRHALGVLVTSTRGQPRPAFLLAVGIKSTRWPFTYPEIQRLQSIAELMDNILSHARLAADAALKARTEHLAMMARGLAHDLKNLITPIASFIVHTDGKFAPASAEAEVHAAAKRSVRRMTDYVSESLFFSSRLTPRFERTEVHPLLESVRELCAARAASRGVQLAVSGDGPVSLVADRVLLQRMLGNLVDNAIDASKPGQTITLRRAAAGPGRLLIEVADDGSGIAAEHLAQIFEPYFTTKHFGDEVRGFGLGLAICEKIARLHHGTIRVRSGPGRGTTVTVELPDRPPETAASAPTA